MRFREWLDTRTLPMPGGGDRTADRVAALDDPSNDVRWLAVFEFQSRPDADKLDATLEVAAVLRSRVQHGDGKYRVVPALVHLTGKLDIDVLDMTLPGGYGIRHAPLVWNVADDDGAGVLEQIASGEESWGMLYWVPLMRGAEAELVVRRWMELAEAMVTEPRRRSELLAVAMVFAELAGRYLTWERVMKETEIWTESEVVNNWLRRGRAEGELKAKRDGLARLLRNRFPDAVSGDAVRMVQQQQSLSLLEGWFDIASTVGSFDEFLAALRG